MPKPQTTMISRLGLVTAGISALLLLCRPAAADMTSPCPALAGSPSIAVEPFDTGLKYDIDRSEAEMTEINTTTLAPNVHLRGLTVDHLGGWLEIKPRFVKVGNGWCLAPAAIIGHVGFKDMTVYIDKKYPKESCQRKAIVYHENKHVTINYQEMNAGLPRMEAGLQAAYHATRFPIYVADLEAGKKYLLDYFSYSFNHDIQETIDRMKRRNTNLDNPQEYANITAMCPRW